MSTPERCPFKVVQKGKTLGCIKPRGHSGPHQHTGEGSWRTIREKTRSQSHVVIGHRGGVTIHKPKGKG